MEIRNEQPTWISTYHKQLRNFPKENTPKSPSLSQAKASELPPTAEKYFVVNYSIWGPLQGQGGRCPGLVEEVNIPFQKLLPVWAHLCWRPASLLELGQSRSSRQASLLEPGHSWSNKWHWPQSPARVHWPLVLTLDTDTHHTATCIVYPKKYAHGFCFAVLCCGYTLTDFPISIRLTSLALWQSNDCPSASKVTLMNMDKYFMWNHYERLHNHNKAKQNKTVCIFRGIYCTMYRIHYHTLASLLTH